MSSVMTVLGEIPVSELGVTLTHEHIFIDLTRQVIVSGMLSDPELMAAELAEFRKAGGRTVVECTTDMIGRDPVALAEMSQRTGLNIVMGSGWYREPFLDRQLIDQNSADQLAEALVDEIEKGVGTTGIRPGIIGEIGSEKHITSYEERVLRAAARAQKRTGLAITTHTARWPNGLDQLAILSAEGVDPRRVIVGHVDTVPHEEYHLALAKTGCFIQFDTIRAVFDYEIDRRVRQILSLLRAGHGERLLLSQDVWSPDHLMASGGGGYSFLLTGFAERMRAAGIGEEELRQLTVENPAHALVGY